MNLKMVAKNKYEKRLATKIKIIFTAWLLVKIRKKIRLAISSGKNISNGQNCFISLPKRSNENKKDNEMAREEKTR